VVAIDVRRRRQRQCRAEVQDGGQWRQRQTVAESGAMAATMAMNNRGGGIINPLLLWFYDKILIPAYFYGVPV
jgi:hypothetical protein